MLNLNSKIKSKEKSNIKHLNNHMKNEIVTKPKDFSNYERDQSKKNIYTEKKL